MGLMRGDGRGCMQQIAGWKERRGMIARGDVVGGGGA